VSRRDPIRLTEAELRGAVLYGAAELIDDRERVIDILASVTMRNQPPPDEEGMKGMRAVLSKTAPKRMGIRIRPERIVSWDHRKLGGAY